MKLTGPDPRRDRLMEPEQRWPAPSRSRPRGRVGAWLLSLLASVVLIALGFSAAIVGVLTGVISRGQLITLFSEDLFAAQPTAAPAIAAQPVAPVATPAVPAAQQARAPRDETFGDWRFTCAGGPQGTAANCAATQQLLVAETGAPIFVWRIVQDGRGGLVGIWQVPETVQLSTGLTLNAGTPQPLVMPFTSCGEGSCKVVATLAPEFIETLKGTQTLSASIVLSDRKNLNFPLSPTGLADALAALLE